MSGFEEEFGECCFERYFTGKKQCSGSPFLQVWLVHCCWGREGPPPAKWTNLTTAIMGNFQLFSQKQMMFLCERCPPLSIFLLVAEAAPSGAGFRGDSSPFRTPRPRLNEVSFIFTNLLITVSFLPYQQRLLEVQRPENLSYLSVQEKSRIMQPIGII